jgi:hypothetical protein
MEPEVSAQDTITGRYPETEEFNPQQATKFL